MKAAAWLKRFEAWVRVEPNAEGIIIEEHGGVPVSTNSISMAAWQLLGVLWLIVLQCYCQAVLEVDNAGDVSSLSRAAYTSSLIFVVQRDTQGGSGIAEGGSDPEAGGPHADETVCDHC